MLSKAVTATSDPMAHRVPLDHSVNAGVDQLTALLAHSRELLAILDSDGAIHLISSSCVKVLGCRADELAAKQLLALVHPDDATKVKERLRQSALLSETSDCFRCRLRTRDGAWRWFEVNLRNCLNDSAIEGILASFVDITELCRMEAERQVSSEIVHALNQTANLDELLQGIHQALKKVLSAENCFVALHDSERDTFSFPFFADQFDAAPPPQKVGRSCAAYVFRTGRAMLIPQSEFDRLAAIGEVELVGSPAPSWLGVPLKTPTATIGVLVVQHYENENAFDMRDLEFLDSVGGHIALAIERRRSEEALRKSEFVFRLLFAHNPLPTWVIDDETLRFIQVNEAAVRQYGYSLEEFAQMDLADIRPEEERAAIGKHFREIQSGDRHEGVWKHRKKDGQVFRVEIIAHKLDYAGRRVRLVVAQDISERQLLEEQLRQAQKMEAVGRLAGGVAHDFNNLLMVIKGHTELLMNSNVASDHISRKIAQIDRAADRAASLTKQLLAFSRMQVLQPRAINLNSVVEDMGKLIPRLIGEDIDLVIRTASDLGTVRADASQMEQVIMNLAVNSRDAMPTGGRLVIETSNADLDSTYNAAHPIVQRGRYVLLAVSDSGTGMDAETQAHIFEPFFTTKEQGKGTGLGLATVYGVVKQSGGFIWVYSEIGKGTCFKIYLPRVDQPEERVPASAPLAEAPLGSETVLLAEDEQDVREVAREFLQSGGYSVIEARDGAEALRLAIEHNGSLDLLVTDMVMPGMTGQELAGRLQQQRPGLRVIYMSGYSEHVGAESLRGDASVKLLNKPFSRGAVLRAVRETLNNSVKQ